RLAELAASAVTTALGRLREQGFSARSLAAHVVAAKAFSRWAWRDGRAAHYTLAGVATPSAAGDRRLVRRPLGEGEVRRLIEAARPAPPWRGGARLGRARASPVPA